MQEFVILTKLEGLDAYSHNALIQFPKYEKFVLCAEIRQCLAGLCSAGLCDISEFRERLMSFLGYAKHCSSRVSVENILQDSLIRRHYKCK